MRGKNKREKAFLEPKSGQQYDRMNGAGENAAHKAVEKGYITKEKEGNDVVQVNSKNHLIARRRAKDIGASGCLQGSF